MKPWVDRYLQCPVSFIHKCTDQERINRITRWKFESPDTLAAANATVLDVVRQHLLGKAVAFIGDSISVQSYHSFVCTLAAVPDLEVLKADAAQCGLSPNLITEKPYCHLVQLRGADNSTGDGIEQLRIFFVRSNFLVEESNGHGGRRLDFDRLHRNFRAVLEMRFLPDYIVLNTGHWYVWSALYNMNDEQLVDRPALFHDVMKSVTRLMGDRLAQRVGTAGRYPQVVYRTDTLSHFVMYNASVTKPFSTDCPFTTPDPAFDSDAYYLVHLYGNFSEHAVNDWRASSLWNHTWILDAQLISRDRRDAHTSSGLKGQNAYDCSHFCLPGAPDAWTDVLMAKMWRAYVRDTL